MGIHALADTVHQLRTLPGNDFRHWHVAQGFADVRVGDLVELSGSGGLIAETLVEFQRILDAPADKGINGEAALVGRKHFNILDIKADILLVELFDLLNQGNLEVESGLILARRIIHLFGFADLKHQGLFVLTNDEE